MTTPDTRAKELAGLLRAEVEFVKGDAAAWGADTYGDLPRTTALLNEAASLIERLYREREKLREALKPFATLADDYLADTANFDDDTIMAGRITRRGETDQPPRVLFADFRRARSALAEQPQ